MKRSTLLLAAAGLLGAMAAGGTALASAADDRGFEPEPFASALDAARTALPANAVDVHGAPGGELLFVDLPGDGSAQVVLYDYAADLTHQITVHDRRAVEHVTASVQPPPSGREATVALGIALDRSHPLPFAAAFAERQGVPLVSADQVGVVAGAWVPEPGGDSTADVCGRHRCVQLVVSTSAGDYLDTTGFVVDLSAGRVIMLGASG